MRRLSLLFCLPALVSAAQPVVRDMSLTTLDGFVLKGTLTVPPQPGPRPVVILAHQFQTDRSGWKPLADQLNAKGIATLALDLRGHGQSTGKGGQTVAVTPDFLASAEAVGFQRIPGDLAQAAAWVRRQPRINPRRLGLAGSSVGAFASLLAAPVIHPVAVLVLSPAGNGAFGEDAGLRMVRAVRQAHAAVLVMAAKDDTEAAENAGAITGGLGVCARMVPGSDHGFALFPDEGGIMAGWMGEYLAYRGPVAAKATKVARAVKPVEAP
ncbi:MAG: alpha/beta fold hydrolase [Holophaga sp.]|nr:alpha/beta fold hydrolase [Holophaga sp.]